MDIKGTRVLVTDGASRQALTIVRGLKEAGCHVTVLCSSKMNVCYASNQPDRKILDDMTESVEDGFVDFLIKNLATGEYDVLLPVAEKTTDKVTSNEDEIRKYVKIAGAPRESYAKVYDKQVTFDTAMEIGIPCPYTRRSSQPMEDFLQKAAFPVIIKPRNGLGSIGFRKFDTREEFLQFLDLKTVDIDTYVVQEFVSFKKRPDVYMLFDTEGPKMSLSQEVLRWYPLDAGSATLTRSTDDPEIIGYAEKLLRALGWQGFANVCFMVDENTGGPKLLEINGRIPAGIKMSWFCGFNVAKQLVEYALCGVAEDCGNNTSFGRMARHSQSDLMWFIKSPERFSFRPSWFSHKNSTDLVFWKDDPMPSVVYTVKGVFQYKDFISKRRHR